jgi:uncharacterized membrane protein
LAALSPLIPVFLSYLLSFIFLGIYWNNHHHMLQAIKHVNGPALWANLHLLFWLSLIPSSPVGWARIICSLARSPYGLALLAAAIAYFILARC